MPDFHMKQEEKTSKARYYHKNIAHETTAAFLVVLPVEIPSFVHVFIFYNANFTAEESPLQKSSSYYSCGTRADGITTSLRFSTTTGRERTVPGRASPHPPLLELGTRPWFSLLPVTTYLPWQPIPRFRSCTTPLGTSRRGTSY